ncbi:Flp pilus assembly protein CpaB [Microvirga arabica]|uniref:Flp pilus assembly protein CpaB n=1 Tax=Microvirga arabica TaxID=1128671 RepID=UPI00193ACB09|nr:Flp pilus assembly protein CpaB [Microvirga arabica]MBM1172013.1 Flp pilus assembly protein CpaB [Microvirga arabica]
MKASSIISLGLAIVLGGGAAYLSREFVQSGGSSAAAALPSGTAVVASQPLAFGTALTRDNLREIPWPSENIPNGAFRTIDEFLKDGQRIALTSFQPDEPILSPKVTGPNQRATLSTLIEEGMRAVSVRVDEVRGVAGFILPGDRVDVVLIRGDSADVLLQNSKVLAIDQMVDERTQKPTIARAVTLELSMQQAQKVILAEGIGRLSLVLRQAGEAEASPARRVLASELGVSEVVDSVRKEKDEEIAKLEARLAEQTEKVAAKGEPQQLVVRQPLVNVIRDATKSEQYTVYSEASKRR